MSIYIAHCRKEPLIALSTLILSKKQCFQSVTAEKSVLMQSHLSLSRYDVTVISTC